MITYLYRLNPPRRDFPTDMTPQEGQALQAHVGYWTDLMARGVAVAFGPVADPAGTYGVAIVRLPPDADPHELSRADPAVTADLGFTAEIHPMPQAAVAGDEECR